MEKLVFQRAKHMARGGLIPRTVVARVVGKVVEAGEVRLEGEMGDARPAVTVLGDDDVCRAQGRAVVVFGFLLAGGAVDEHDDVGVLLDGAGFAGSESIGRLPWRDSTARESWESAMTGICISLARILRPREISATSTWRDSVREFWGCMSCR